MAKAVYPPIFNFCFVQVLHNNEINDIHDFKESELVMGVISISKEFFVRIDKDKLAGSNMLSKAAQSKNEMRLTENEACLLRDLLLAHYPIQPSSN